MDYYRRLISEVSERVPKEEQTTARVAPDLRRTAANRLTKLMESSRPFSFIRLGDMELGLLLCSQDNMPNNWLASSRNEATSSTVVWGHPGIGLDEAPRLLSAYENATYVDFHERWWINRFLNAKLVLNRSQGALRNEGVHDSHIFLDWPKYSLKEYSKNRRIMFVGAEAGILQCLFQDTAYRKIAKNYFSNDGEFFFLPITERAANKIDEFKALIVEFVEKNEIDTVFVSLGGAAKILSVEIAIETNCCCFDFGGAMRGLTYSGADGQNSNRSTHHPFFVRVPFDTYMDAFERAFPGIEPERLLVKAQCQVLLDSGNHVEGESQPTAPVWPLSGRVKSNFESSLLAYTKRYGELEKSKVVDERIGIEFRHCVASIRTGRLKKGLIDLRSRVSSKARSLLSRILK